MQDTKKLYEQAVYSINYTLKRRYGALYNSPYCVNKTSVKRLVNAWNEGELIKRPKESFQNFIDDLIDIALVEIQCLNVMPTNQSMLILKRKI